MFGMFGCAMWHFVGIHILEANFLLEVANDDSLEYVL